MYPHLKGRKQLRGHEIHSKIIYLKSKSKCKNNAFLLRVAEPWNTLHEPVVQAKYINSFKNRLDKFWSNQSIVYNYEAPLLPGTGLLNC